MNNYYDDQETTCGTTFTRNLGQKLMFFVVGGGIGAAIALLFAPKPGRELRGDVAELAGTGYDKMLVEANKVKHRTTEVYETAMQTGGEVLDVVHEGVSAIKKEVTNDINKVDAIVEGRSWGSRAIL